MFLLSRRSTMFTFSVLSITAIAAIPALATQVVKHDSKVTVSQMAPAFHGRVKSSARPCIQQRKVKLFRAHRHRPDTLLGTDQTTNRGRWKVIVNPLRSGAYYAKVKRRTDGTAGTIHVCRSDRSRFVGVD